MVYNKTKWQDEIPDLTKPILDSSGKQKVDPQTGRPLFELVQTGTRITSAKLNNMEDGIGAAHTLTEQLAAEMNGDFVSSGLVFSFANLVASWTAGVAYVKGRRFEVAAGSLTLTAKQGQYIYLDASGVVQNTTTEATAFALLPLWYFATDASKAITSTDRRRLLEPGSYALKSETVVKEEGKGLSANDYSDSEKAKVQNHNEQLADLVPRLNTLSSADLLLQPGTQTIEVKRDVPFNVLSLKGKMLLNLLGRRGNFDSLPSSMGLLGGSVAISNTVKDQGTGSMKVTMAAGTSGIGLRLDNIVKANKSYIAIAKVYMESGQEAYIRFGAEFNGSSSSSVTTKGSWQTIWTTFQASKDYPSGTIDLVVRGADGNVAYLDSVRMYEIVSPAQVAGYTSQRIEQDYPYTEGLAGVRNPYAIRWTDDKKTNIGAMLAIQAEFFADPASGANADTLSRGVDGQYYRTANYRKIQLTGSLNWRYGDVAGVGFKQLAVNGLVAGAVAGSGIAIKYDGKILPQGTTGSVADVQAVSSSGDFFISIPQADSGWGDNYTPTDAEIRANIYGWVMYDGSQPTNNPNNTVYNGTGTKAWARRTDGVSRTFTDPTNTLPIVQAPNYTPYELFYRLATPVTEPVVSEGQLSLAEGSNVLEIGTGLILREKATVFKAVVGSAATVINNIDRPETYLKNKAQRILNIYRDGLRDLRWVLSVDAFAYGTGRAYIPNSIGMTSDAETYTVSYIVLDNYPTIPFTGTYPESERAALAEVVQGLQQTIRRVSVVENRKVEKDAVVNWITPTLLNGWTGQLQYAKLSNGLVVFRGYMSGGAITPGTLIFNIPAGGGFRTNRGLEIKIRTSNGSGTDSSNSTVLFGADGSVRTQNSWLNAGVWFDGISYVGEL